LKKALRDQEIESRYGKLWEEIQYAAAMCNRPLESRSKVRKRYEQIVLDAVKLANAIASCPLDFPMEVERVRQTSRRKLGHDKASTSSPFDLLAYEFFPVDRAIRVFEKPNWEQIGPSERCDVARELIGCGWPSMTDLLKELARQAAKEAKKTSSTRRIVDRKRENGMLNFFVRQLYTGFFDRFLHGPMMGTVAHIATVVFREDITKELIRQALPRPRA